MESCGAYDVYGKRCPLLKYHDGPHRWDTHYTYRAEWSPEDNEYIGLVAEFPSLSWLAPSAAGAIRGIEQVVGEVIDDMGRSGETVPVPAARATAMRCPVCGHTADHHIDTTTRLTMTGAESRIVDLDEVGDCPDDAVITLQMLVEMHGEPHRRWRITPSAGGAWNYEKATP